MQGVLSCCKACKLDVEAVVCIWACSPPSCSPRVTSHSACSSPPPPPAPLLLFAGLPDLDLPDTCQTVVFDVASFMHKSSTSVCQDKACTEAAALSRKLVWYAQGCRAGCTWWTLLHQHHDLLSELHAYLLHNNHLSLSACEQCTQLLSKLSQD